MKAFVRFVLYPTITAIVHGLAAPEKLWFEKQSVLAADTSLPEAQRGLHSAKATRSRTKLLAMEALAAAPGELYQVSQCAFAFFDVMIRWMRQLARLTGLKRETTASTRLWLTHSKRNLVS